MQITNLNTRPEIGANSWFVEIEGRRLLLDVGTHPKLEGKAALPQFNLIEKEEVDAIVISHCHHDHVGALPIAARLFPKAHVLMTELSYFLVERVLHNSVNVMQRQREEKGIADYPLYTHDEVDDYAPRFQGFRYFRPVEWASAYRLRAGLKSPVLEFCDAGHTLGSAGVFVQGDNETLFYTGDVCFHDQTLLRAARFEDVRPDVLIMETTRGGRAAPQGYSREAEADRLAEAIRETFEGKGSVLIPTFALGRTQEILALLALLMAEGRLRRQPVYIGGLGRVFTEIYDLQAHRTYRRHHNLQLNEALQLVVADKRRIDAKKIKGGRLYVLTAGMLNENTAAHDLALRIMGDERHSIFFVGYADPETPGGRLKQSKRGKPFFFSETGGEAVRRCRMEEFNFSAHAAREDLLEFVDQAEPRTVVLGHGDKEAVRWFKRKIKARRPETRILVPAPGETVEV